MYFSMDLMTSDTMLPKKELQTGSTFLFFVFFLFFSMHYATVFEDMVSVLSR